MAQLVKKSPLMWETWGLIPGLGQSTGEGKSYPLQYSGLQNSMDCIVHGGHKSQAQLSEFHFTEQVKDNFKINYLTIKTLRY